MEHASTCIEPFRERRNHRNTRTIRRGTDVVLVRYVVGVDTFLRFGCQKKIADGDGIALHNIIVCVSV